MNDMVLEKEGGVNANVNTNTNTNTENNDSKTHRQRHGKENENDNENENEINVGIARGRGLKQGLSNNGGNRMNMAQNMAHTPSNLNNNSGDLKKQYQQSFSCYMQIHR